MIDKEQPFLDKQETKKKNTDVSNILPRVYIPLYTDNVSKIIEQIHLIPVTTVVQNPKYKEFMIYKKQVENISQQSSILNIDSDIDNYSDLSLLNNILDRKQIKARDSNLLIRTSSSQKSANSNQKSNLTDTKLNFELSQNNLTDKLSNQSSNTQRQPSNDYRINTEKRKPIESDQTLNYTKTDQIFRDTDLNKNRSSLIKNKTIAQLDIRDDIDDSSSNNSSFRDLLDRDQRPNRPIEQPQIDTNPVQNNRQSSKLEQLIEDRDDFEKRLNSDSILSRNSNKSLIQEESKNLDQNNRQSPIVSEKPSKLEQLIEDRDDFERRLNSENILLRNSNKSLIQEESKNLDQNNRQSPIVSEKPSKLEQLFDDRDDFEKRLNLDSILSRNSNKSLIQEESKNLNQNNIDNTIFNGFSQRLNEIEQQHNSLLEHISSDQSRLSNAQASILQEEQKFDSPDKFIQDLNEIDQRPHFLLDHNQSDSPRVSQIPQRQPSDQVYPVQEEQKNENVNRFTYRLDELEPSSLSNSSSESLLQNSRPNLPQNVKPLQPDSIVNKKKQSQIQLSQEQIDVVYQGPLVKSKQKKKEEVNNKGFIRNLFSKLGFS